MYNEPRLEKTCLSYMRTTKAQISLRIRAVWSAPLLFAAKISLGFYIRNFKTLASFCGCAGRFESYLVENTEDRVSRDEDLMLVLLHLALSPHLELVTLLVVYLYDLSRLMRLWYFSSSENSFFKRACAAIQCG